MCSNLAELPSCGLKIVDMGPWRSPVAHLHGMQGVRGSNPLGSTKVPDTDTRKALNLWFGAFRVAPLESPAGDRAVGGGQDL